MKVGIVANLQVATYSILLTIMTPEHKIQNDIRVAVSKADI